MKFVEQNGAAVPMLPRPALFPPRTIQSVGSFFETKMTGYEQSPDYGDPPRGKGSMLAALVAVIAIALMFVADA